MDRHRSIRLACVAVAVSACLVRLAGAQEAVAAGEAAEEKALPVEVSFGADVVSRYVWRGQVLNDEPVVQPTATLAAYGFSFNVWGSLDTTDNAGDSEAGNLQEVDYTGSYSFTPFAGLDLSAGYVHYDFAGLDDTAEVFLTATGSCTPLSPTLSVYYDVDEVRGFYVNAGVSHEFALAEKLGLTLAASLGWGSSQYNAFYFGEERNAFNDAVLGATLSYQLLDNLSVYAYAKYAVMVEDELREAAQDSYGHGDSPLFGIGASFSF